MESTTETKIELCMNIDCSICIQPCLRNNIAIDDLILTHCNHMFHKNCIDNWNYSGPNCRRELIAFFIDETDNSIIEANTIIPTGSQVQ